MPKQTSAVTTSHFAGTIYYWLLFWLALSVVVAPQFEELGNLVERICLTCVLIAAVLANRNRKAIFNSGLAVAAVAFPLLWGSMIVDSDRLSLSHYLVLIVFFAFNAVAFLIALLRDHSANPRAIAGIVCVYLLLGLTWACTYSAIEFVQAEPFANSDRRQPPETPIDETAAVFSQYVYFSFVTMSTLGYGDITPRTTLAETATWLQSVVGQFFIAVLVARIINSLPGPPRLQPGD